MTDENGGFFSDADNSGSYEGYSYNEPAPATESDPQPTQPQEIQIQPVAPQNQEYEALKQKYDQLEKNNQRWEDTMTRMQSVFSPAQAQPDPNAAALNEFVTNPNTWAQRIQDQAVTQATQRMQYEMAEREILQKYPDLEQVRDLVSSQGNVDKGFAMFQQKNGRLPATPHEQIQAAVDSYISRTGFSNQTPQQASNTIPLNLRSHNPSKELDPDTMSKEQFNAYVQGKVAQHYR